ncbi:hypothetical protein T02_7445 [Trichinella nativa]|uniref:Uncharacterized protein n=3 Tax=Trichinella TaxID=6333 RepID=A0A0V1KWP4_9BILA|nr:hypothetical protein T05_14471 [Trichinella murrelli]KRY58519.1 hypothetical protein T03_6801 [Trichinella britovi]KRZ51737.1 hypothetical protein T02_7445 [Trichinella nativa]KRZ92498.1 hypothetical protein T08_6688 [Trichinella sp. T8]
MKAERLLVVLSKCVYVEKPRKWNNLYFPNLCNVSDRQNQSFKQMIVFRLDRFTCDCSSLTRCGTTMQKTGGVHL